MRLLAITGVEETSGSIVMAAVETTSAASRSYRAGLKSGRLSDLHSQLLGESCSQWPARQYGPH